jgi:peptidoglycan/xylan/chitin deacetylase (PgdA/CDA1 family)
MPSVGTARQARLSLSGPGLIRLADTGPTVAATTTTPGAAAAAKANELGLVPVLMHHRVIADRTSEYDVTPKEFEAELQRLWKDGYVPITAADYVSGKINVPAGKKPVVMTFDDGSASQFGLTSDGQVDPDTAVGILLGFAREHPDFPAAGTFYVNKDPFEGGSDAPRLLRWLVQNGFEVGNHTLDHAQLSSLDDEGVQKELADEAQAIEAAVPGYTIRTMALPYGAMPSNESLAVSGSSGAGSYGPYAVMLVGANPAPSPFASDFDPAQVPRIRTAQLPWRNVQENYAFDYWLTQLEDDPDSAYVSDGDPSRVSYPESESGKIAPRFQARANAY